MTPKERRQKRREVWSRRLRRVGIVVGLVVVAVGLPALTFWGYSHLMDSDYFSLTYVDVEGLNYLEEEALVDAAEEVGGEHILEVYPERLEATIASLPFVEDVEVERKFPDRMYITIDEYDPVAVVVDDGFWLVDDDGRPFLEIESPELDDRLWALPMISGLSRAELETVRGRRDFATARNVYQMYHDRGLDEHQAISEVHVDELLGISLIVGETGTEVRLGRGKWEERLDEFAVVQNSLIRRGLDPAYLLVDQEGELSRVVVGRRGGADEADVATPSRE